MRLQSTDSNSISSLRQRKRRTGLSEYTERRMKQALRRTTCSEPWVEAQFKSREGVDRDGRAVLYRYHDGHAYPPGGANTKMVRCPACGVFTPPNAMEHDRCLDHADHGGWGQSPSALAIRELQMRNLRLELEELAPEDLPSLRREIEESLHCEQPVEKRA